MHVSVRSHSGTTKSSVEADLGINTGVEYYSTGKEHITITVTPTWAYLSGSPTGLTVLMGLTPTQQKKVGTKSIVMKKGTAPYKAFLRNLTVGSFSNMLPASKGTVFVTTTTNGQSAYELTWKSVATTSTPKVKSVLLLSAGKKTLPISETITSSTGGGTTTFTHWGEKVNVTIPANLIPYASVLGG